ncbi:hypothetical protein SESI111939_01875 [Serratia silvae]
MIIPFRWLNAVTGLHVVQNNEFSRLKFEQFYFFALFPNFDRLEPKSKTYGIIDSELAVSFGKNRTYRPYLLYHQG